MIKLHCNIKLLNSINVHKSIKRYYNRNNPVQSKSWSNLFTSKDVCCGTNNAESRRCGARPAVNEVRINNQL